MTNHFYFTKKIIPRIKLIPSKTPITRLDALEINIGHKMLYLKSDGQSGKLFGGNKIRNLEFIIADAKIKRAKSLVTFGSIESNHALATTIYGAENGFAVKLYLCNLSGKSENELEPYRRQLRKHGAEVKIVPKVLCMFLSNAHNLPIVSSFFSKNDYIIPIGGATALGCLGHFHYALELYDQIIEQGLPVPTEIFLPLGSGGTIAGLIAGLTYLGLQTRVNGIYISKGGPTNKRIMKLAQSVLAQVPNQKASIDEQKVNLIRGYEGPRYGTQTPDSERAKNLLKSSENVSLDDTYGAKAMAAYIDYGRNTPSSGPLLFLQTNNCVCLRSIEYSIFEPYLD